MGRARPVLADDVVRVIGDLQAEDPDATFETILVRLGIAPDEVARLMMVGAWSIDRLEKGMVLDAVRAALRGEDPPTPPAMLLAWCDGFAIGLAAARATPPRLV